MQKMILWIKRHKLSIIVCFFLLGLILYSFYEYFDERFSYSTFYYEWQEKCSDNSNKNECSVFNTLEHPKEKFDKIDAITLSCEIVEHQKFNLIQWLAPLLVIILGTELFHKELSTGMFKNYLTRKNYATYIKEIFISGIKVAWILPASLILIFIISCFITRFNFSVDKSVYDIAVYQGWKYNNFIFYGVMILILLFLQGILYSNIGIFCCKKNKNMLVTIVMSYILFIVIDLIVYVVIYALIINSILGFKNLTEYFNITGYWFFQDQMNYFLLILISTIMVTFSYYIVYKRYRNKEEVIIENEKKTS